MKKWIVIAPLVAIVLAGCSSEAQPGIAGINIPNGTTATLMTDRPAREVADCIAKGLRTSAQPESAGYLVLGSGPGSRSYRIHPVDDKLKRFSTQIEQLGNPEDGSFVAATCLLRPSLSGT